MPKENRPTLKVAWIKFRNWINSIVPDTMQQIVLCAFNGFGFDFRILLYHLDRYLIKIPSHWILIDPCYDVYRVNGSMTKFESIFNDTVQHANEKSAHGGLQDAIRLAKFHALRSVKNPSYATNQKSYEAMIFNGLPTRRTYKLNIEEQCSTLSFFNKCCPDNLKKIRSKYNKKFRKMILTFQCQEEKCPCYIVVLGRKSNVTTSATKQNFMNEQDLNTKK